MEKGFIQLERGGYGFRYCFNAGLNEETCVCDEEGVDVYEKDLNGKFHYIASIPYKSVDDIEDMTDGEFDELLAEYGIL